MSSSFELIEIPDFGNLVANPDDVWWNDNFCINDYVNAGTLETDIVPSDMNPTLFVPEGPPKFFSNQLNTDFIQKMFMQYKFPSAPAPFIEGPTLSTLAHCSRRPVPIICSNKPSGPHFVPPLVAIFNSIDKMSQEAMFFMEETIFMAIMQHLETNNKSSTYLTFTNSPYKLILCNPLSGLDTHRVTSPDEDRMFGCLYSMDLSTYFPSYPHNWF